MLGFLGVEGLRVLWLRGETWLSGTRLSRYAQVGIGLGRMGGGGTGRGDAGAAEWAGAGETAGGSAG